MNDLVFLDTETTGLEPDKHEIWELAWAVNDENPVRESIIPHSLLMANLDSLEMNGYYDRVPEGVDISSYSPRVELELRRILKGNTLVCANPTFDRMFLRERWGDEPYHYRSLDIESMAVGILEYDRPKGLKGVSDDLRGLGYNIGEPTHAAWIDVVVLRESYRALRDIQRLKNEALARAGYKTSDFKPSYGRDVRNEPQAN